MDFETEEQQVEALKKWWKENGSLVIAGIVLGVAILSGWRFYSEHRKNHAEQASVIYETLVSASSVDSNQQTQLNKLMAEYADTPYASLSALVVAKQQLKKGEIQQAQQQLEWVVNNAQQTEIQNIARLRLIRVLLTAEQYDQALALAKVEVPASFAAMYEEIKGDIYLAQGDQANARSSYDKAILLSGSAANRWLRLKRDDLGQSDEAEPSA